MALKPLLFISHSSADTAAAEFVHAGLASDFDIFLDKYDLRAGSDWQKGIETAIVKCDCAIVMLSPNVKAKPEWVAAEAFAFTLRQRALDPSFLVLPLMLPGFTPADLSGGPLAPAKLQVVQGLTIDPAALDLQPVSNTLAPVLQTFLGRLPFQSVTLSLASVIEPLGTHVHAIIAQSLKLDASQLTYATNRSLWLAAALLKSTSDALERAFRDLEPTHRDAAKQIFKMAAPYSWVDCKAADSIAQTGLGSKPRAPVTMSAIRSETPKFCVLRSSLTARGWKAFDGEAVFAETTGTANQPMAGVEEALLGSIRQSLKDIAGFPANESPSDVEIEEELEAVIQDEPIFVYLEPWFADMDGALLKTLRTKFPRLVFMVRTKTPQAALAEKFSDLVLLPSLAATDESAVYRMYNRCLPGAQLP